jgi:uncharacterized protein HemY
MDSKRDRARDLANEGLDKMVEGDKEKGRRLIDEAKKVDPRGVEDLAEEVERDKEKAERFTKQK